MVSIIVNIQDFYNIIFSLINFVNLKPIFKMLSDKPLLMLQSIKRALKLNTEDPRLHFCLARFQLFVEKNGNKMAEAVKKVIENEGKDIFSLKTAKARNDQFMLKNSSSLDHRVLGKSSLNTTDVEHCQLKLNW